MIQSALNNVIVKVKTKWVKNFSDIMKVAHSLNNNTLEPADLVNIVGEVVSIPKKITTERRDYKGFSADDIRPGNTVIFSHDVIFKFDDTHEDKEPVFRNRIWYRGQEYFKADIRNIFAVVRDGKIRMQNGYVMVEQIEKQVPIILPASIKKTLRTGSAVVSHIRNNLPHLPRIDVERGDRVYFKPTIIQLYQINDKPFGILRQSDIVGKSIQEYADVVQMN